MKVSLERAHVQKYTSFWRFVYSCSRNCYTKVIVSSRREVHFEKSGVFVEAKMPLRRTRPWKRDPFRGNGGWGLQSASVVLTSCYTSKITHKTSIGLRRKNAVFYNSGWEVWAEIRPSKQAKRVSYIAEILDNFLCRNMLRCWTLLSIYFLVCECIFTGLTLVLYNPIRPYAVLNVSLHAPLY